MQNQVPSGWQKVKLGEISAKIYSGGTPNTTKSNYWSGNLNWLSSGETGQKFIYSTNKRITEEGVKNSSTKLSLKGDVVIASAGQGNTRGQTSYLKTDTYINQSLICIRGKKNVLDNLWLLYNLSNRYLELRSISDTTSIRGSLTTKIFKDLDILIPNYFDQQKIASILSAFDDKIELNYKIAKTLEDMASAIFKEWFVKFRFPGCEKAKFVNYGTKKLPEEWKINLLESICEINYGKDLKTNELEKEGYPVYGGNGLIGFSSKFLFENQQIIVGCRGAYSGNVFKTKKYSWVTHNSLILKIKNSNIGLNYLFYYLRRANVKSTVTGSAQPQITTTELNKLPTIIPKYEVLSSFEKFINPIEKKRYVIEEENQKLAQMRDLFLPKLMKGEIRV